VRTYNFPENRISDHRVGFKAYNLDQVIDGELDAVINALADAEMAEKLSDDGNPGAS
jgi:peptide chain release factor 1